MTVWYLANDRRGENRSVSNLGTDTTTEFASNVKDTEVSVFIGKVGKTELDSENRRIPWENFCRILEH